MRSNAARSMPLEDQIEAAEVLHAAESANLHFRFIGKAKSRQIIVNVQFASSDEETGERLRPEEFDFMIVKVLRMILARLRCTPNPALH